MSKLIQKHDNRAAIRWKLLTGVSALALTAYVSSTGVAKAEDTDRPQVWIELGTQIEMMQGLSSPFTAPFMSPATVPVIYGDRSFTKDQRPPLYAFGADGKISFQPENSDWIFSAGIRYGRSHTKRSVRHQSAVPPVTFYLLSQGVLQTSNFNYEKVRAVAAPSSERHMILDFSAGRDVGIGAFGHDGTSNINAGVRMMNIKEGSTVNIFARPEVYFGVTLIFGIFPNIYTSIPAQYGLTAHTARSFKGIGPLLSWNASAAIAGNSSDGELMLDWGVDAAILFGRQKAKTDHSTHASHFHHSKYDRAPAAPLYTPRSYHSTRSQRVTVPNVGGHAGLSLKWPNAKLSIGYRYDTFLNAMDTGIDATKKSNVTFNGPYASISVGL